MALTNDIIDKLIKLEMHPGDVISARLQKLDKNQYAAARTVLYAEFDWAQPHWTREIIEKAALVGEATQLTP